MKKQTAFYCLLTAIVCVFTLANSAFAGRDAVTDDGREVLLKDDGTWEYLSSDRFATSEDGTRVRLREDGSWQFVGNVPVTREEQVRTSRLDVVLQQVDLEIFREKLIKSTRFDAQTVFHLEVDVSSYSDPVDTHLSHFNLFKARDSRGKDYPVIAVSPQKKQLQAGEKYQFSVRIDGGPAGFFAVGTRYLYLTIDKAVFGSENDLEFSKRVDDLVEKKMDKPFDNK